MRIIRKKSDFKPLKVTKTVETTTHIELVLGDYSIIKQKVLGWFDWVQMMAKKVGIKEISNINQLEGHTLWCKVSDGKITHIK